MTGRRRIRWPKGFTLTATHRHPRSYDALQSPGPRDDPRWRFLTRQMLDAEYIPVGLPEWKARGWRLRFVPAPRLAAARKALERPRRRIERWLHIPTGSPRAAAPRFDEDSFDRIIRKIGSFGIWMLLLVAIMRAEINFADLPRMDPVAAQDRLIRRLGPLLAPMKWFISLVLIAIATDLAMYLGHRLHRLLGIGRVGVTLTLLLLLWFGLGIFFGLANVIGMVSDAIEAAKPG